MLQVKKKNITNGIKNVIIIKNKCETVRQEAEIIGREKCKT